jgi:hypothetical protein
MHKSELELCKAGEGTSAFGPHQIPELLRPHLHPGDHLLRLGDSSLLVRSRLRKSQELAFVSMRWGSGLARSGRGEDWLRIPISPTDIAPITKILLSASAIEKYFYSLTDRSSDLYRVLRVKRTAELIDIRLAWRVARVGGTANGNLKELRELERAFNLLANPEVREAYDAWLQDEDNPLPFPYAASGDCVVAGQLSKDGETFFADSILAFKPNVEPKRIEVLLRQCEFLPDRIVFKDSKRKVEIWLDAGLLEGLRWNSTWNNWKPWLRSRISIASDFVEAPKVHFEDGERVVTSWWIALPSRISVAVPASLSDDIESARAFHGLLGRHADILTKVCEEVAREPVEASTVQFWFDELGAGPALKPEFATWQPDYDAFYFDQLRQRSRVWFLFREEYLFVLPGAVVSEIPMAGHASYIFAEPPDMERFLRRYSGVVRTDIRVNKDGVATELGFVGRVLHGTKRKRWLADVLKHSTTGKENVYGSSTDE